jgi:heme-degrading monooxygenase HmoA
VRINIICKERRNKMFVEMKTITVKPGTAHLIVEDFQGKNAMAEMEGFIDKKKSGSAHAIRKKKK